MNAILVIEGCDCAGKSFLANQIMKAYPNHVYIHNAVTDDIYALHKNTIDAAIEASKHHLVIVDRLHLSEKVYGTVFRNGPSYDYEKFDKWLDTIPNLKKILCIVDKETCLKKHSERLEDEMFHHSMDKVWTMYNDVNDPSWTRYNWKTDEFDFSDFTVKHGVKA